MYNFNDGNIHHIHIELKDFHGNSSSIVFNVESKFNPEIKQDDTYFPLFRFSEKNKHERKDIELEIPEGALYTNINFRYKNLPATNNFFSSIHVLHTNLTPLHKPVSLKIRAEKIPKKLEKKLLVVQVDTLDFTYRAAGVGTYKNGWIETNIQNFGNYAVAADTIPPLIIPLSIKNKETITETNRLRFKISDNLSGINKIEGRIDGKWALFEYDAKNNLITHYFDDERFELKKRHTFVLKITDYQNNSSVYEASFWK